MNRSELYDGLSADQILEALMLMEKIERQAWYRSEIKGKLLWAGYAIGKVDILKIDIEVLNRILIFLEFDWHKGAR